MRIVIDQADFRRLSSLAQQEILRAFSGKATAALDAGRDPAEPAKGQARMRLQWRRPVDIDTDQAVRLVHGLSEDHKRRLALFTRKNGRVRMKEIMAVTNDTDLRATSDFQKAVTRRLRRMIDDPDHKAQLIGWDFEATKWDAGRTTILDGVYYVSEATARALRAALPKQSGRKGS